MSWYTPAQIARERGIAPAKVRAWIDRGELVAINIAESRTGRPRWRISADALRDFDLARSSRSKKTAVTQRIRRRINSGRLIRFSEAMQ